MKHPKVKYQIVAIQLIGKSCFKVKVRVSGRWKYIGYFKNLGLLTYNDSADYESRREALQALSMYQKYGVLSGEEEIIESN